MWIEQMNRLNQFTLMQTNFYKAEIAWLGLKMTALILGNKKVILRQLHYEWNMA